MKTIQQTCLHCQDVFDAPLNEVKRGNGKYCSRQCGYAGAAKARVVSHEPNLECTTCSKSFYRSASKLQKAKHGFFFCSRVCKEKAQSIGNEHSLEAIMPTHYDKGQSRYRQIAFRENAAVCQKCGYDEHPEVLEVHHIDRDRTNNYANNLEVLCPTCHAVDHFISGDGKWKKKMVDSEEIESSTETLQVSLAPLVHASPYSF